MPKTESGVGFRNTDTSEAAAKDIEPKATTLRGMVLTFLRNMKRPVDTESIAKALRRPYASIQPRLSELREAGLVEDSGERGQTQWGKKCIMWQIKQREA